MNKSFFLVTFLLLGIATNYAQADKIKLRSEDGFFAATVEVVGIVGTKVIIKEANGDTGPITLAELDKDSLIRVVTELGRQMKASPSGSSPTPRSTKPTPRPAKGKAIQVSLKRLEVFGKDYVGKRVRFTNVRFYDIKQSMVSAFPMIQIKTDGLITTYRKNESEKWVNFVFDEGLGGETCWYTLANKKQWAEFLLGLKEDDRISIEGVVVDLPTSSDYGIIVTHIEKAK